LKKKKKPGDKKGNGRDGQDRGKRRGSDQRKEEVVEGVYTFLLEN